MGDFDWIDEIKMELTLEYPESWSYEKLSRKDARRFQHLMYKHSQHFYNRDFQKFKNDLLNMINNEHLPKTYKQDCLEKLEIIRIIEKYKMLGEDVSKLASINSKMFSDYRAEYRKKPQKEGRDNKGIYVGSGGYNRNMVRYPSKKRSKRVWKTFYNMFPSYAEVDGWDGTKSSRIDFSKKK